MTQIEMQALNAQIRGFNAIARSHETTDWNQRRYEIAREVSPMAIKFQSEIRESLIEKNMPYEDDILAKSASMAVDYADALIKELKGVGGQD